MKILILTSNYPRKNALNNGVFIHQQVKALQELGAECHVLSLYNWYPPMGLHRYHGYWREGQADHSTFFEEFEGVKIHAIPMFVRMPSRLFKDNYYDRAARAIIKYVKGSHVLQNASWLYAHFLTDYGYIGAKVKDALHVKLAAITRGDDVHAWPEHNPALADNIRYVFEHADLMLANNKRLALDALKFATKVKPEFRIAYNGIDYKAFERKQYTSDEVAALRTRYKLPVDKKILLCIGRAEFPKGWNELLETVAESRKLLKDWVLLAVTDNFKGRYAIDIDKKVTDLRIEDIVRVQRYIPHNEVKELYWLSDAFILPSYNEGISNAVMEAMASGLWVITTDVGGHAEIMQHNVSGFLIKPRSNEAVKESLRYLVENYDTRKEEISRQAVLAMQRLGDYKQNAQKLLGYLTDAL